MVVMKMMKAMKTMVTGDGDKSCGDNLDATV